MNRSVSTMPASVIRELASQISTGNVCYIDRYTAKINVIDKTIEDEELLAAQEEIRVEIEKKIERYVKLEKIGEKDQLMIMKDFLDEITDKSVRKELLNALRRKSPIRNFTTEIESNMGLRQHWTNFYTKESERWVTNFLIDAYNY